MKLAAVGGHSRNIGKTSLLCSLVASTPELDWTAVKVAQSGHGICSRDGQPCDCAVDDPVHPYSIDPETNRDGPEDTSRMLRAGAKRALWVRSPQGRLGEAIPSFEAALAEDEQVIVESNSLLDHMDPAFYVAVLDFRVEDFKASCRRHLERADVFALVAPDAEPWEWFDRTLLERRPWFAVESPSYCAPEIVDLMRERIG